MILLLQYYDWAENLSEEPYIVVFGRDVPTYVHKIAPRRPEFKMTRTLSDVVTIRCGLSINHIEGGKQFHIVNTSTSFCWSWTFNVQQRGLKPRNQFDDTWQNRPGQNREKTLSWHVTIVQFFASYRPFLPWLNESPLTDFIAEA